MGPVLQKLTELKSHQVHIWHAFLPQHRADLAPHLMGLLSDQERCQQGRFHFEKDQHRYLMTRALVRTVLSRYAPIAPTDWIFENNEYGRPKIVNQHPLATYLDFNVSHSDGLVVLIVSTDRMVGIDTESTARHAPLDVADRFFSPHEVQSLYRLPNEKQAFRFWELWTFKESYIKARGMGLSLPLEQFSIELTGESRVSIAFDGIADKPDAWQLWQYRPDPHHLVALCLERTGTEPVEFSFWNIRPLDIAFPLELAMTRCSVPSR